MEVSITRGGQWLPHQTVQKTSIMAERPSTALNGREWQQKSACCISEKSLLRMAKRRWRGTWRSELNLHSHKYISLLEDDRSTQSIHLLISQRATEILLHVKGWLGQWRHDVRNDSCSTPTACLWASIRIFAQTETGLWKVREHSFGRVDVQENFLGGFQETFHCSWNKMQISALPLAS